MLKTTKRSRNYFSGSDLRTARLKKRISRCELAQKVGFWDRNRITAIEKSKEEHWVNDTCLKIINEII